MFFWCGNGSIILFYLLSILTRSSSLKRCAEELGGGQCPDGNTCCRISEGESGCIPSDLGANNATCCAIGAGCGAGYSCLGSYSCQASPSISDPLVQVLPQYQLGQLPETTTMHAFPMTSNDSYETLPGLAYYSSHGDVSLMEDHEGGNRHAIIAIHGSERNADDYLCSLLTKHQDTTNSVVIAPWFAACSDVGVTDKILCWDITDDPNGPWRYGADATKAGGIGSFGAMDRLISFLLTKVDQLTLVGHSSGGQFVQRWSLMSPAWDNRRMKAVVANPSSYAYLFPERLYDGRWQQPSTDCATYNEWEWGFEVANSTIVNAPYVASILHSWPVESLIDRFRSRKIFYLIGGQDKCTGHAWCESHGLETLCQDQLQGYTRWERQNRYLAHLARLDVPFQQGVVPGVGHDHSLIFNSAVGRQVIFGDRLSIAME